MRQLESDHHEFIFSVSILLTHNLAVILLLSSTEYRSIQLTLHMLNTLCTTNLLIRCTQRFVGYWRLRRHFCQSFPHKVTDSYKCFDSSHTSYHRFLLWSVLIFHCFTVALICYRVLLTGLLCQLTFAPLHYLPVQKLYRAAYILLGVIGRYY